MLTRNKEIFKLGQTGINNTLNTKPLARLLVFAMAFLCALTLDVKAETLTYEVCESGCEYTSLDEVEGAINNISDLSDKDIVININSNMNMDENSYLNIGDFDNMLNSVTINGNNHGFNNYEFSILANSIEINDCNNLIEIFTINSEHININNSDIKALRYSNGQIKLEETNISKVLNIDEISRNNLNLLILEGNIVIENMNFDNGTLVLNSGSFNIYNSKIKNITNVLNSGPGTLDNQTNQTNIYNCLLNTIFSISEQGNITTNVYNSKFSSLKYKNIINENDEAFNEWFKFIYSSNYSYNFNYNIYDLDKILYNGDFGTYTTVYFDKEVKLKSGDILNLVNYLDYYTEDKEIEYTIEDESIAKIENKELIALKEGSTKVTVTTDDGHIVYRINLVVEKETIPEKIDKMTIKVPITGSKIKAWVVVVSAILLGVIGVCSYMLIKRKK